MRTVPRWRLKFLLVGLILAGSIVATARVEAASVTVNWLAPTTNADGTQVTDLAGFRIYLATSTPPCPSASFVTVPSPTTTPAPEQAVSRIITGLTAGTTYFASVTAVDTAGNESACSDPASGMASGSDTAPSSPLGSGFNEGTGTTTAARPGNNHPSAMQLNGTTEYVSVPNPGLFGGDFTASTWLFLTRNTVFQTLMEALDPNSHGWELNLGVGGQVTVWTNGAPRLTTAATVPLSTWTYVTLRRTGALWELFLNGVKQPETGIDGTVFAFGSCPFVIGVDADAGCTGGLNGFLQGSIDEVRVDNRSLTDAEIQADMAPVTP
jgi:hypothetical protein